MSLTSSWPLCQHAMPLPKPHHHSFVWDEGQPQTKRGSITVKKKIKGHLIISWENHNLVSRFLEYLISSSIGLVSQEFEPDIHSHTAPDDPPILSWTNRARSARSWPRFPGILLVWSHSWMANVKLFKKHNTYAHNYVLNCLVLEMAANIVAGGVTTETLQQRNTTHQTPLLWKWWQASWIMR